jgi:hypothetical protein
MVSYNVPNKLTNFFSGEFIENAVAAKNYEIDFLTAVLEV